MRTLKKSLALVLALVMVLGLGVVGASADNKLDDYTDANELGDAYVEAMGVMTGLGIIDGVTDTTIDPDGTYTREQAAKIIAYMVLGADKAEALSCTVAPFDDVPADHWSAKFIAFCVKEGIIDGMTDTTFEPYATLTGYQWAKMLLSAVGFNSRDELTGADWAIHTGSIAAQTGLFDGDLKGGDHVALSRQQAVLYAFNTLTKIGVVVYSEALGDYVYAYGYDKNNGTGVDRFTYEGTLAANVFDLHYVEGIITDNEGNGDTKTTLGALTIDDGSTPNGTVTVKADTGLDLFRHAVRVWYVGNEYSTTNRTLGTGIYTYDLATSVEFECYGIESKEYNDYIQDLKDDEKAVAGSIFLVGFEGDTMYVRSVVDNSAYSEGESDIYVVQFNVRLDTMGVPSVVKDTHVIGSTEVPNDDIKTDISDIEYRDPIIVLQTSHNAYYVAPVTSTTGTVRDVYNNTETIVLTDGTVIEKSRLAEDDMNPQLNTNYTITLDTHGHYIDLKPVSDANLYFYTGAFSYERGTYYGEATFAAQVVNVITGEDIDIPVDFDFVDTAVIGYYDIGTADKDGIYAPERIKVADLTSTNSVYDETYYFAPASGIELTATSYKCGDYYYSNANVDIIIVNYNGSKIEISKYDGVDELLTAYKASKVTLGDNERRAIMTFDVVNGTNNVSTIFAVTGNYTFSYDKYAYVPTDIDVSEYDGYVTIAPGEAAFVFEDAIYVNGELSDFQLSADAKVYNDTVTAGFYEYFIDSLGNWHMRAIANSDDNNEYGWATINEMAYIADDDTYLLTDNEGNEYVIDGDAAIGDIRTGKYDKISDLPGMMLYIEENAAVPVGFTFDESGKIITVVYIADSTITQPDEGTPEVDAIRFENLIKDYFA